MTLLLFMILLAACSGSAPAVAPTAVLPASTPLVQIEATATTTTIPTATGILPLATTSSPPTEPAVAPTVAESTATPLSPTEPPPLPTATLPPDPAAMVTAGRTEDGAFFRGNPEASVTFIDFSDFL